MKHGILMHEAHDDVGVAVRDLEAGSEVGAVTLEGQDVAVVTLVNDVPLGHKVALHDIDQDQQVIEYGSPIGRATAAIAKGAHVHVHNLKSLRW